MGELLQSTIAVHCCSISISRFKIMNMNTSLLSSMILIVLCLPNLNNAQVPDLGVATRLRTATLDYSTLELPGES